MNNNNNNTKTNNNNNNIIMHLIKQFMDVFNIFVLCIS